MEILTWGLEAGFTDQYSCYTYLPLTITTDKLTNPATVDND